MLFKTLPKVTLHEEVITSRFVTLLLPSIDRLDREWICVTAGWKQRTIVRTAWHRRTPGNTTFSRTVRQLLANDDECHHSFEHSLCQNSQKYSLNIATVKPNANTYSIVARLLGFWAMLSLSNSVHCSSRLALGSLNELGTFQVRRAETF